MEQEKPDWVDSLKKHLNSLSKEEIKDIREKYFKDDRPKGWVSIEQHLPMMFAVDIMQGYSVFKVRDKDGNEFETKVAEIKSLQFLGRQIRTGVRVMQNT